VKLFMMRLISRLIGRHRLVILSFYPHILRYLNSGNKEYAAEIMAMVVESCHDMVPPDVVKPILTSVLTHFATDFADNKFIVIGLNAIREMLVRMPFLLDES
jgi:protein SDA1